MKRIIAYLLAIFMIASVTLSCASCDMSFLNDLLEDPEANVEDTNDDYAQDEDTTKKSKDTEEDTDEETTKKPKDTNKDTSDIYIEDTTEILPPGYWETNTSWETNYPWETTPPWEIDTSWETTPPYDTEFPIEPPIDMPVEPALPDFDLDFGGSEVTLLVPMGYNATSANKYFLPENTMSHIISDLSHERDTMIGEMININIRYHLFNNNAEANEKFITSIKAGTSDYDVYATGFNGDLGALATNGYLMTISALDFVNLDASYWNRDLMDDMTLNGQYFAGVGNMMMPETEVITFNKILLDERGISYYDIYDRVNNEAWTLEDLYTYTKYFGDDIDGNGIITEDDLIGLIGSTNMSFVNLMYASGLRFTQKDYTTEKFELVNLSGNRQMLDFVEQIRSFKESLSSFFTSQTKAIDSFRNGNSAFALTSISRLYEYESCEDFGILPMPKYDKNQKEYTSLYRGGMFCVPNNLEDPNMIGAVLEYINAYSTGIREAYYMQYVRSEEDIHMLNIATEHLTNEFLNIYAYSNDTARNYVNSIYKNLYDGNEPLPSYFKKNQAAIDALLKSFQG